jgi:hypothetical protein
MKLDVRDIEVRLNDGSRPTPQWLAIVAVKYTSSCRRDNEIYFIGTALRFALRDLQRPLKTTTPCKKKFACN